ncbi:phage tail assembly protein [Undibacterium sp. Ji42W]|uniref:phage tail assembly protein n=1 Tax=Undibacterium sp. Ji42W TaxID=3413039 RepID=UPI003BF43056
MSDTQTTQATAVAASFTKVIVLDEPLKRGDNEITEITLRKPKSGELRGVSLIDLGNMNVVALQQVLPRITAPILTAQDVANLDPADLVEIASEVSLFLVKKADRMAFPRT